MLSNYHLNILDYKTVQFIRDVYYTKQSDTNI